MKKMIAIMAVMLVAPLAMASTGDPVGWANLLTGLFGETGAAIVTVVSIVLAVWSQVRQLIPATWLAKLPTWLIDLLEWLAANKGKAKNESFHDPKLAKRTR